MVYATKQIYYKNLSPKANFTSPRNKRKLVKSIKLVSPQEGQRTKLNLFTMLHSNHPHSTIQAWRRLVRLNTSCLKSDRQASP